MRRNVRFTKYEVRFGRPRGFAGGAAGAGSEFRVQGSEIGGGTWNAVRSRRANGFRGVVRRGGFTAGFVLPAERPTSEPGKLGGVPPRMRPRREVVERFSTTYGIYYLHLWSTARGGCRGGPPLRYAPGPRPAFARRDHLRASRSVPATPGLSRIFFIKNGRRSTVSVRSGHKLNE